MPVAGRADLARAGNQTHYSVGDDWIWILRRFSFVVSSPAIGKQQASAAAEGMPSS
jgi:hypothetical protein